MSIWKFDHISVIVANLDKAIEQYSKIFDFDPRESFTERDYTDVDPNTGLGDVLHFFIAPVGQAYLEIMEPVKEDGMMMKHLRRKGEGFHHVGVTSNNVVGEWEKHDAMRGELGVIERCPRVDQYGVSYWFLHPKTNFGALWEIDAAWAKTSVSDMTPIEPTPKWS